MVVMCEKIIEQLESNIDERIESDKRFDCFPERKMEQRVSSKQKWSGFGMPMSLKTIKTRGGDISTLDSWCVYCL